MQHFYSNGKLLITGEYLVLDGALALAIPTKYGQSLYIEPKETNFLDWESIDHEGNLWFSDHFVFEEGQMISKSSNEVSSRLIGIFKAIQKLNPSVFNNSGLKFRSILDFPNNWGLGSSSTLINNLASWAKIDPFELLKGTFEGSGYDIACAHHNSPITYQLKETRIIKEVDFCPSFKDSLFFVHLNKKQNSRDAILNYKKKSAFSELVISEINDITRQIIECQSLSKFEELLNNHEEILSKVLNTSTIKCQHFKDYEGTVKSLGAWGGDFILAVGNASSRQYFKDRGYNTIINFDEMALGQNKKSLTFL